MFTGIVEGKGRIKRINRHGEDADIEVIVPFDLCDEAIGDSIAVNGACLTVTALNQDSFTADMSVETLSKTSLGFKKPGEVVNIERAVKLGARMGGHLVTGHIDGLGRVRNKEKRGKSVRFDIALDDALLRYVAAKGSVALDGVSLTVNTVDAGFFSLNIITHTLKVTALDSLNTGDQVNVETDIIGKYVEKLLTTGAACKGVDYDLLRSSGFM